MGYMGKDFCPNILQSLLENFERRTKDASLFQHFETRTEKSEACKAATSGRKKKNKFESTYNHERFRRKRFGEQLA